MSRFLIFIAVAITAVLVVLSPRGGSAPIATPKTTVEYLVEFGVDGKANVDWSGSVTPATLQLSGWQFEEGDEIKGSAWKCRTQEQTYWDTPYERRMQPTSHREKVAAKGLLIELGENSSAPVHINTAQGSFDLAGKRAPGDAPREFLAGRVRVTSVPVTTALTPGPDAEDFPSMVEARDGSLWVAYQAYTPDKGDQIYARHLAKGVWSEPMALAGAGGDYYRTAIAQDAAGKIWVVWSAREGANFDLYSRTYDGKSWSEPQRLTSAENADMNHVMASDAAGHLYLAYQSARSGNFDIYLRIYDGRKWLDEIQVSSDPANDWEPAVAVAPDGSATILWDTYSAGNYDVVARTWKNGQLGPIFPIAASGAFEAHVSAQYDRQGRLWAAWDQGDWSWGKDYGYEIPEAGRGILTKRQVRVAVFSNGRLQETKAPVFEAVPEESRQVFHRPSIVMDRNSNPWVFFRTRVNLPQSKGDKGDLYRALWRLEATTLRNGKWSRMIEFPRATGRIDLAVAVTPQRTGGVAAVWATDGRDWPTGGPRQQDLEFAVLPSGTPAPTVELVAYQPPADNLPTVHTEEARDIQRVRAYRATAGKQTFRIARGDIHRHTDLSWDGNRDGSLDDSYRYAMDAAGFDFIGICDHEAGQSIPYNWSRLQKAVDLYTIADRFTPLYSYERSVKWPNGHRNVFFSERGKPVLPLGEAEANGETNTGKVLYPYLHKFDGVSSPHTSGSGAGTDFRDSDAAIEPVVEIYQGYRSNFETLGAPRSPSRKESTKFTAGFVQSAWARGLRLGVQASSDHVSTHISYAGLYVDRLNRDALIAAMKARRTYAATDNIFIDLRMGDHFMGDSFNFPLVLPLSVYVSGTQDIDRVDVIHNNQIVYSVKGNGTQKKFEWTDNAPERSNYYYVRVLQKDGQLCWSSPIWVDHQ